MKIYSEKSLQDFNFWSGADDNAAKLTGEELNEIECFFETEYPDGIDETHLNDLFRFEFEWICSLAGLTYDAQNDEIIRE